MAKFLKMKTKLPAHLKLFKGETAQKFEVMIKLLNIFYVKLFRHFRNFGQQQQIFILFSFYRERV